MPRVTQVAQNALNSSAPRLDILPGGYEQLTVQSDVLQSLTNLWGMSYHMATEMPFPNGVDRSANFFSKIMPDIQTDARTILINELNVLHQEGRQRYNPGIVVATHTGNGTNLSEVELDVRLYYYNGKSQSAEYNEEGFWVRDLTITDNENREYYLVDHGTKNSDGTTRIKIRPNDQFNNLVVNNGHFTAIPLGHTFGIGGIAYNPDNPSKSSHVMYMPESFVNNVTFEMRTCKILGAMRDAQPNISRYEVVGTDGMPMTVDALVTQSMMQCSQDLARGLTKAMLESDAILDPNNGKRRGWGLFKQVDEDFKFNHTAGNPRPQDLKYMLDAQYDYFGTELDDQAEFVVTMTDRPMMEFMANAFAEKYGKEVQYQAPLYQNENEANAKLNTPRQHIDRMFYSNGRIVRFVEDTYSNAAGFHAGPKTSRRYRSEGRTADRMCVWYTGNKPKGEQGATGGTKCIQFYRMARWGSVFSVVKEGMSDRLGNLKRGVVDDFSLQAEEIQVANGLANLECRGALAMSEGI